ncbi:MAG: helix-turn-helix domain-containing protein [Ruminococcaceae bacterium]|jgi:transcriptional regulator with XRE-family HTH domain|nr:helix-turn-helix domain-containing protein [Oscillospiraceae bacterium]
MKMTQETIGKNIRKARREKDMTQDTLAERLAVTESAVSQWEVGKTVPDLMLIPALCAVLGVTSDWLLGVNEEKRREEIAEISSRASDLASRGHESEAAGLLEDALKRYPNDEELIDGLLFIENNKDRAIELGEWMLKNSTDESNRRDAIQCLVYAYREKGDLARAKELAYSMPPIHQTSDFLLNAVLDGEEWARHIRDLRSSLLDWLAFYIGIGGGEDAEYAAKKVISLFELLYDDGDYGFAHGRLYDSWIILAKAAAGRKEIGETVKDLTEAAKHALAFDAYVDAPEYTHTSVLFCGTHKPNVGLNFKENIAQGLLNAMSDPVFDFLRAMPEFEAIRAKIEPSAGEWKV